ncbi:MAG: glycosyltransferase [Bacteroidales bacterium]
MTHSSSLSPSDQPLLSVVIPVYNVGQYLPRCLDSVTKQTYPNLEIIVVNDGSTDNSAAIIADFAFADPRVKVVDKKNGGLVSARKAGLEVATGKYIHHLDGDDYIEYDAYQRLVEKAEETNADLLLFPFLFDQGNAERNALSRPYLQPRYTCVEFLKACYTENGYFAVWHYIHKRSLYDNEIDFNLNLSMGEDAYLTTQLAYYAQNIVSMGGEPLLHYILRQDSISNKGFSKKMISDFLLYPDLIDRFLKETPVYTALERDIASIRIHSWNNIIHAGYLANIRTYSRDAMVLYQKYPDLKKQRSTKTYYKLYYLYHLNPLFGYIYALYYKRKGKIISQKI